MKVCVVGSGGREHALAWVLGRTADVVVTPGNAGIPGSTKTPAESIDADLFVIGPEQPLVDGLADRLRGRGARVFGPGADGARLEGSKVWMKSVLVAAGVPTAAHGRFDASQLDEALAFVRRLPGLYVIKTDGLAAGKGVLVTESQAEAEDDVRAKLSGASFGDAGRTIVIEEGLSGPEVSLLCLCDGRRVVALPPAQDFKRVGDGDSGANTGGMGAYSPVPIVDAALVDKVIDGCVEPTLAQLRARGIDYRGVLYAGMMLTPDGPKVLEYNVRFGDPESQVVLPRLAGDVAAVLAAAADGALDDGVDVRDEAAVTVVLAAHGYPSSPRTGDAITGLDAARSHAGALVFCAGVADDGRGGLVTNGGRVLAITGTGPTITAARDRAYTAAAEVRFDGMVLRRDIAAAAAAV